MASIPQSSLFRWQEIEDLRDLERLRLVLGYLPDEPQMLSWMSPPIAKCPSQLFKPPTPPQSVHCHSACTNNCG